MCNWGLQWWVDIRRRLTRRRVRRKGRGLGISPLACSLRHHPQLLPLLDDSVEPGSWTAPLKYKNMLWKCCYTFMVFSVQVVPKLKEWKSQKIIEWKPVFAKQHICSKKKSRLAIDLAIMLSLKAYSRYLSVTCSISAPFWVNVSGAVVIR